MEIVLILYSKLNQCSLATNHMLIYQKIDQAPLDWEELWRFRLDWEELWSYSFHKLMNGKVAQRDPLVYLYF